MRSLTAKPKLLLPLVLLAAACTTTKTGTGFGSTASGANPVNVTWTSSDSVSGTMSATLADGTTYTGHYFEATNEISGDSFGWGPGPWGNATGSATNYSGLVLADLASPAGAHMRCAFRLVHPSSGMSGGGGGLCQPPNDNTIDVTFPPSS